MELAEPFDMSLPAVSRHLKVLERAGDQPGQGCAVASLPTEPAPLEEARSWIDTHRGIWEESFSRLDDL